MLFRGKGKKIVRGCLNPTHAKLHLNDFSLGAIQFIFNLRLVHMNFPTLEQWRVFLISILYRQCLQKWVQIGLSVAYILICFYKLDMDHNS